jgi:AcrR family transcriptional regulator
LQVVKATQSSDPQELSGDKAVRIVEAMRASVAERGFAASTFDQVARAAGVSRGLLHYYFGTKERLLVEAVRRECEIRFEQLDQAMAGANSADDVLGALVHTFEAFIGEGPKPGVMFFEMLTLAQRNADIAKHLAELGQTFRAFIAEELRAKDEAGEIELRTDPDTAATFVLALADGLTVRLLSEPDFDIGLAVAQAAAATRALLG